MMRPLKAFREIRERILDIEKSTRDVRVAVSPLERRLKIIEERLDKQLDALAEVAREVDALRRVPRVPPISRADLRKFVERSNELSRRAEDEISLRLRRHEWVLKKTQERLVRVHLAIDDPGDESFLQAARPLIRSRRTFLGFDRLYVLWQAVQNTVALDLPAVEIGSYRGGSAYLMAQAFKKFAGTERDIHVVDTFTGHIDRQIGAHDAEQHRGKFTDTSYDDVKAFLAPFSRVTVHQGDAPTVVRSWPDRQYSLLHLDVDLYEPTRDCLAYFAPRIASGGVVVLDDYGAPSCPGVRTAIEEVLSARQDFLRWDTLTEQMVLVKC